MPLLRHRFGRQRCQVAAARRRLWSGTTGLCRSLAAVVLDRMAISGAAFRVCRAVASIGHAGAVWIVPVGVAVAVVVTTVTALRLRWRCAGTAIFRTIALILAWIAGSIPTDRWRSAVHFTVVAIFLAFAGAVTTAVRIRATAQPAVL